MNLRITHPDLPFVAKIQLGAPAWVVRSVMHHPGVSRALQSPDLQRYLQILLLGLKKKGGNFGRSILLDKKRIVFDVV